MLKNIYAPLSGGLAQEKALETISNNLANMNTVGFKQDNVTFTLLEPEPYKNYRDPLPPANYKVDLQKLEPLHGNEFSYVGIAGVTRDKSQGPAIETENPTDMMLEGDGYFAVNTKDGERYTRAGNFKLGPDGELQTATGDAVLGAKGTVYLRSNQFTVNQAGEIYQDGQLVDRLKVVQFEDEKALERVGLNYYMHGGSTENIREARNHRVTQGYIEGSNVNAIKSLTAMIIAHRSYEAYQKAVSNFDRMMDKSSNTIGAIRV
jgi:flagellar basal-body rod protein FlgG